MDNPNGSVTSQTIVHHIRESPVRATLDMEEMTLDYQSPESHIYALLSRTNNYCKQLLQIDCSWFGEEIGRAGGISQNFEKMIYNIDSTDNCSCPYVNRCDGEK